MSEAENQWFGDMMILQVLADSEQVNDQEREVLTRWLAASARPSSPALLPHRIRELEGHAVDMESHGWKDAAETLRALIRAIGGGNQQ